MRECNQIELKYREPKPFYEILCQGRPMTEQELIKSLKFFVFSINLLNYLPLLGIMGAVSWLYKEST